MSKTQFTPPKPEDGLKVILNRTNWKQLTEQKYALLRVIATLEVSGDLAYDLDGIVNWIDWIQDLVADSFESGEKIVFPAIETEHC